MFTGKDTPKQQKTKKRKRDEEESSADDDADVVMTNQAKKNADSQAPLLKLLTENRTILNDSMDKFSKVFEDMVAGRKQSEDRFAAEREKEDKKEEAALKSERMFQRALLMMQAKSMGMDPSDLMQLM